MNSRTGKSLGLDAPVEGSAPEAVERASILRPVRAIHRFFSEAPADLVPENVHVYAFTNWCMLLGLIAHSSFALLFCLAGITPMVLFNVGSTLLFATALFAAKRGRTHTAMGVAIAEVVAHGVLATRYTGLEAGFHYQMVLVISVAFWFTAVPLSLRLATVGLVGACYAALIVTSRDTAPWSSLPPDTLHAMTLFNVVVFLTTLAGIGGYYTLAVHQARAALSREYQRSEALLNNMLPGSVARRLKDHTTIADRHEACSVMFADMAGFTSWSAQLEPEELVEHLNSVFTAFDHLAGKYDLEKIKTIGDAYMVAGGVPTARPDHAEAIAEMALDMREYMRETRQRSGTGLSIRIGIHSGPAVAGVIGLRRYVYDLWGDTVNIAARMESHGVADEIQLSEDTATLLRGRYLLQDRGIQQIKGKGPMRTYMLLGRLPAEPQV
jgi:adenylate cyclase